MKFDKSMIEVAYETLKNSDGALTFKDLASKVAETLEMSEEEASSRLGALYTSLSLDGRFVILSDNTWDLRARHTYEKVHIDVNDVYSEVEESDTDIEELDEDELKEEGDDEEGEDEEEEGEKKMSDEEIESLGIK